MRTNSYRLTKKQYQYIRPAFSYKKFLVRGLINKENEFYFIGTEEDYKDVLNRLKGLSW